MRDHSRIYPFLMQLKALWEKYPDLRFGQLISNFQDVYEEDIFYLYDAEFIE